MREDELLSFFKESSNQEETLPKGNNVIAHRDFYFNFFGIFPEKRFSGFFTTALNM